MNGGGEPVGRGRVLGPNYSAEMVLSFMKVILLNLISKWNLILCT